MRIRPLRIIAEMERKTILRVAHDRNNPYMQLNRSTAQNKEMSYEAVGMLTYLLSKPDDWQVNIEDLQRQGCGRDKAYRILAELMETGYARRVKEREKGKIVRISYLISEAPLPEKPETVEPYPAQPEAANPDPANPTQHIKESLQEKDSTTTTAARAERPNIFLLYEQAFGQTINGQMLADELKDAEQEFPADWLEDAFREAVMANARNWRYVRACLLAWKANGKPATNALSGHRPPKANGAPVSAQPPPLTASTSPGAPIVFDGKNWVKRKV
jgi:DnaD/phage-associated family protein